MPWQETNVMEERMRFIVELRRGDLGMSELCRAYGVSRDTGYTLKRRYEAEGVDGLKDRSRAPHSHPNAVAEEVEEAILIMRKKHATWGPKKIRPRLEAKRPHVVWPAESTIGEIIRRHGLSGRPRRRRHVPPHASPLSPCEAANDVWGMDFKGWFRTGDGERCDPFSLSDLASRYVLRLQVVERTGTAHVWPILDAAFREFGLPKVVRSDNGPPFASLGAGGLSELSVRIIKAGVTPERIEPGKPQQNGRHERLHRTVKEETACPPASNRRKQQERFDTFTDVFNEERPHEALGFATPAQRYQASRRGYAGRLREPDYPAHHLVRRVRRNGDIKWKGGRIFMNYALVGEPVGIEETDNGLWTVRFGPVILGRIDEANNFKRLKRGMHPSLEP
jgi:transposase InsO family protein